jgi:hypothetical protein
MLMSNYQNSGQNHNLKMANRSSENVAQFKYLGMIVTKQNLIQEEIKSRLNTGNGIYHSLQNLLCSRLMFRNLKIKINNYNFSFCFVWV